MIKRTTCLVARGNDPFRNLAVEKHLLDTLPEETAILFLYQNDRSVLVGRNQNPWSECRVEEFLEAGGKIARRLSGGGAVYEDLGCLNFAMLVPKVDFDMARQYAIVERAIGSLGVEAWQSGRNDLLVGDRKVSDNAFLKVGASACHHGTVLLDTDLAEMSRYMSGDGTQAARHINLRTFLPELTMEQLEMALYYAFGEMYGAQPSALDEMMFDQPTLNAMSEQFGNPEWVYPESIPYGFTVSERFPWGGVTVKLHVENGVIKHAKLFTDAMEASLFPLFEQALTGCPYFISAINGRIRQKLALLRDPGLLQITTDVNTLICGRIRMMDRNSQDKHE